MFFWQFCLTEGLKEKRVLTHFDGFSLIGSNCSGCRSWTTVTASAFSRTSASEFSEARRRARSVEKLGPDQECWAGEGCSEQTGSHWEWVFGRGGGGLGLIHSDPGAVGGENVKSGVSWLWGLGAPSEIACWIQDEQQAGLTSCRWVGFVGFVQDRAFLYTCTSGVDLDLGRATSGRR